jgi:hypothetical protein
MARQRGGIGRELIRLTHERAGEETMLILLAAPKVLGYYRFLRRAGEHRRRIFFRRWPYVRGHRTGIRFAAECVFPCRHRPDLKFAFELAMTRPKKHLTSATKSNGIIHTMPYWDERFAAMGKSYPDIRTDQFHIDILCAHFVQHPDWFDVVVGSNLFGDILSDLGPAVAGSIGIAASANINPEKKFPSMFEPVHGSAPDIAGKFIAIRSARSGRRDDAGTSGRGESGGGNRGCDRAHSRR